MRLFLHELRAQQKLFWRSRELAFFTFLFPLILYVMLGSANRRDRIDGAEGPEYLLAGMIGYGAAATGFGGLAILLVLRREAGILKRLRATPLPATAYLGALLASMLVSFLVVTVALVGIGRLVFDARLPARPLSTALLVLLGAAAFSALGLAAASLVRSRDAAGPVVNGVYLPMAFLSGSFFSPDAFPEFLQYVAAVLPLTYYIELVRDALVEGEPVWANPVAVAVVAAWALGAAVVALKTFSWEPRER